jgi:hypothetical protein
MVDIENILAVTERKRSSAEHTLRDVRIDWEVIEQADLTAETTHQFGIAKVLDELQLPIAKSSTELVVSVLERYMGLFCRVMQVEPDSFVTELADLPETVAGRVQVENGITRLYLNKQNLKYLLEKVDRGIFFYNRYAKPDGEESRPSNSESTLRIVGNYFAPLAELLATFMHKTYHLRQRADEVYFSETEVANIEYKNLIEIVEAFASPELLSRSKEDAFGEIYAKDPGERAARVIGLKALITVYRRLELEKKTSNLPFEQVVLLAGLPKAIENEINDVVRFFRLQATRAQFEKRVKTVMKGSHVTGE